VSTFGAKRPLALVFPRAHNDAPMGAACERVAEKMTLASIPPFGYRGRRSSFRMDRLAPDVDARSPDGRRFSDIHFAVAAEFEGADPLKIRDIALLRFAAEKAVAAGQFDDIVRLHNTIERKEKQLQAVVKREHQVATKPTSLTAIVERHGRASP